MRKIPLILFVLLSVNVYAQLDDYCTLSGIVYNPGEHGSGGVVQATDAVFRNNGKSIRATDYSNYGQNPNVEIANASFFRQCSFTVDEDYIGDETFYSHVELSEVDGIRFYACSLLKTE